MWHTITKARLVLISNFRKEYEKPEPQQIDLWLCIIAVTMQNALFGKTGVQVYQDKFTFLTPLLSR